jgi:D-alanyl-lipoteichoic acid acyltransferase DltB (MBOAT superfamily)
MLFNSVHFVLFFLVVTAAYFGLPHRRRWLLLLTASCYFYMCFIPVYLLILGFTIGVDYWAGIRIEANTGRRKRYWLLASLLANLSVLAVFKYYNFINDNISALLNGFGYTNHIPELGLLLPVGLSFHTFQAMSYTIEVYRGRQQAERNFGIFSLYVLFYPQLVAGPIERPQHLLHQFYEQHRFELNRVAEGLKLILWGFFMKLVVADRLALYVDAIYSNPERHSSISLITATVFFAFQIYADFAGYSNIAIGSARVMGFKLMTNFNRPYFSKSIAEFWKRWHISLSTWFRDYLYIPLGGRRVAVPRWYLNLLVVFLVSGLWHGASWNFIIWGGLNGLFLLATIAAAPWTGKLRRQLIASGQGRLYTLLQILITFGLICITWVFFRAATLSDAWLILQRICTAGGPLFADWSAVMLYSLGAILFLVAVEYKDEFHRGSLSFMNHRLAVVRYGTYTTLIMAILLFGVFDGGQFIYFQF